MPWSRGWELHIQLYAFFNFGDRLGWVARTQICHFTSGKSRFLFYYRLREPQNTWWYSCLRYCVTNLKVAVSILDSVIGIFHWHNPSGRTMALRLTRPLTEMSTRNISRGVKGGRCVADHLTTFMCRLYWNLGSLTSWKS